MKSPKAWIAEQKQPWYMKNVGAPAQARSYEEIEADMNNGDQHRCQHVDSRGKRCKKQRMSGNAYCRSCQRKA